MASSSPPPLLTPLPSADIPTARAQLRAALAAPVSQLHRDLALISSALEGPDPEYALDLLRAAVADVTAVLKKLPPS